MRLHLILSTLILAGAGSLAAPRPEAFDVDVDVAARDAAAELPACLAKRLGVPEEHDERDVEIPTERDVEIPVKRDVDINLSRRGVGTLGSGAWAGSGAPSFAIKALQHLLGAKGHSVAVDGKWGPKTSGAVKAYQKKAGLGADGKPGPKTLGSLASTVKRGSNGKTVRAAQTALNGHGAELSVDGAFGSGTHKATVSFQKQKKLGADGIIGKNTWTALFKGKGGGGGGKEPEKPKGTYGTGRCPKGKAAMNNDVKRKPNGCGGQNSAWIPDGEFTTCCNHHDLCYGDCSKTKDECDSKWLRCMKDKCNAVYDGSKPSDKKDHRRCFSDAELYHSVVRAKLGKDAFKAATKKHCDCL